MTSRDPVRMFRSWLVVLGWLVVAVPLQASATSRIAVLEFQGDGTVDDSALLTLADKVRSEALKYLSSSEWSVMTRENMLVLLRTNAEGLDMCLGECEVETGQLIGADLVVSGRAVTFGTRFTLILKAFETASGELVASEEVTADNLDGLWDELDGACAALFGGEEREPQPTSSRFERSPRQTEKPAVSTSAISSNIRQSTALSVLGASFFGTGIITGTIGMIVSINSDSGFPVAGMGIGFILGGSMPMHIGASVQARMAYKRRYPDRYISPGDQAGGVVLYSLAGVVAIVGFAAMTTEVSIPMGSAAIGMAIGGNIALLVDADKYRQLATGKRRASLQPPRRPYLAGAYVLPTEGGAALGMTWVLP